MLAAAVSFSYLLYAIGQLQATEESFNLNGESSLDLEYAMGLVGKTQPVTLYQVGDFVEGASFNNLLDALDGSFCTFEGGDDPQQDGIYPDPSNATGSFKGMICLCRISFSSWSNRLRELRHNYACPRHLDVVFV